MPNSTLDSNTLYRTMASALSQARATSGTLYSSFSSSFCTGAVQSTSLRASPSCATAELFTRLQCAERASPWQQPHAGQLCTHPRLSLLLLCHLCCKREATPRCRAAAAPRKLSATGRLYSSPPPGLATRGWRALPQGRHRLCRQARRLRRTGRCLLRRRRGRLRPT